MKMILNTRYCPAEWENVRVILIYKEGRRENTENWKSIAVTSIIYRAIFCRIAQSFHKAHENEGISMF
jgi:hypothetical protein